MIRYIVLAVVFLMTSASVGQAGNLKEGRWSPAGCGTEPPAVSLDLATVETYNRSIERAKAWEQQAKTYAACMVAEANADNAAIVKAANDGQARIKNGFDRVSAGAAEAQRKFGGKKTAPQVP